MKKIIVRLLIPMILVIALVPTVSADRTLSLLVDDAWLLDTSESDSLRSELEAISERLQVEVAVVTVDSLGGKSAMSYADDFYDDNGYGWGEGDDCVLLLVAMDEREYHITTHGFALNALSDYALMLIEDAFLDDLSNGFYYEAFMTFAKQCELHINNALSGSPSDFEDDYYGDTSSVYYDPYYGYEDPSFDVGKALLVSLVIGLIAAFLIVSSMKRSMTTVRAATNAQDYVDANSLRLNRENDQFLYTRTTRVPRSNGNSSGRSGGSSHRSSSHRSSSGRSHGGRGGRF